MGLSPISNPCSVRSLLRGRRARAFSLPEALVAIGIVALLVTMLVGVMSKLRGTSHAARCLSNLHNIARGFTQYASDYDEQFPVPEAVKSSWESLLEPYIGQKEIFACPSDTEIYPVVGSSYDWRDTPDPTTTLVGHRTVDPIRGEAVLAFETLPGWHAKHRINVLHVDGSADMMADDECMLDLQAPACPNGMPSAPSTKGAPGG